MLGRGRRISREQGPQAPHLVCQIRCGLATSRGRQAPGENPLTGGTFGGRRAYVGGGGTVRPPAPRGGGGETKWNKLRHPKKKFTRPRGSAFRPGPNVSRCPRMSHQKKMLHRAV